MPQTHWKDFTQDIFAGIEPTKKQKQTACLKRTLSDDALEQSLRNIRADLKKSLQELKPQPRFVYSECLTSTCF